ncbi:MAG: DEAD/DEAH box helicase, partial [Acetobacteraceae bacterium]|nr:DEAD/DEAH box helicase [Acetobacteraceae bacterium]
GWDACRMAQLGLRLTPHGRLVLDEAADAPNLDERIAGRLIKAFADSTGHGLLQLGAGEVGQHLPPAFVWWRGFSAQYVTALCLQHSAKPDASSLPDVSPPTASDLASLVLTAPMMPGAEYISTDLLLDLWHHIGRATARSFAGAGTDLQSFLKGLNPAWNLVGRVHFNLAENRRDQDHPFAFMASYTTRLSAQARAQHVPLGQALQQYAGATNRDKLLSLLMPVQRAAETCGWLKRMVDGGEIFHPLRWTASDAARFLASASELESAGVGVRMPASWRSNRPTRPQVTATIGARAPSTLGLAAVMDFRMAVMLDGDPLTEQEVRSLLAGTETLVMLRGQWVEIDRERLQRAMAQFRAVEELAERDGLTFAEASRLLSGAGVSNSNNEPASAGWAHVTAGRWLQETLRALRAPDSGDADPGPALRGTLRPYQKSGVAWLRLLAGLGLGACLADDMGLGKTIQVLALLLVWAKEQPEKRPSLLVAPASLLANWATEIERFAPSLNARILHLSAMRPEQVRQVTAEDLAATDLIITSYGSLLRLPVLAETTWRFVVLDEAQAIKNSNAKQSKAAKRLTAQARIALTGTPVENHLGDLWSIFDFINPGLLGTAKQFTSYTKGLSDREQNPYGPLRELVRPYILRRMKTDKAVIADLPDKTEITAHCNLSRKQAALYGQTVSDLAAGLEATDGIQRKGVVLATLMRLKQICNHPSQWLNDGAWAEQDSGKWARLREIAEVVASRQEKMLVFTQFREITDPLAAFLGGVFGQPGLVLHGQTVVRDRKTLVQAFQEDDAVPFFVLSLKAGGSGLTLTAASHVVHFDRWWNPAVENQATDRAYRIGQKKNVLVHKFICQGTVEQRIDALIEAKKTLSENLLTDSGGGEISLTELPDDELLRLVALDLNAAMKE